AEDELGHPAHEVLLLPAFAVVLHERHGRERPRAGGVRWAGRRDLCRDGLRDRAAVDDIAPERRSEEERRYTGHAERKHDDAHERGEVEVHAEQTAQREVERLSTALDKGHDEERDDAEDPERREQPNDHLYLRLPPRPGGRYPARTTRVVVRTGSAPASRLSGPAWSTSRPRSSTTSSRSAAAFSNSSSLAACFIWPSRSLISRTRSSFGSCPAAIGRPPFS